MERDSGGTVVKLGNTRVHTGRGQRQQLHDARQWALQDGEGKVPETSATIHGGYPLGAPRYFTERWGPNTVVHINIGILL